MIPNVFQPVPIDFEGPCLLEVLPEHRSGRCRWWRPNGQGYTNDVWQAGIYRASDASGSERSRAVSFDEVTQAMEHDARVTLERAERRRAEVSRGR